MRAEISALEDVVAGLRQLAIIATYEQLQAEYNAAREEIAAASAAYRADSRDTRRLQFAESGAEGSMQRASAYQATPSNAAVLADHRMEQSHG